MVAVLACSQTAGGSFILAMACPTTRVELTRESLIKRRLAAVYRQFTLLPARLMTAAAPFNSSAQLPWVQASHTTTRQGAL
jgi:hypothetical protein